MSYHCFCQYPKFKQDVFIEVNEHKVKIAEIKNPELNHAEWIMGDNKPCPDCERIIHKQFTPIHITKTAK